MAWWQVLHILSCIACWLLCAGSSRPESGRGHFLIPQPHLHSIVCCHLSDCHCKFKNGIVKCICDGSLDSHIFPAFLFHTMFPGCVRKVGLFPVHSEGCLHETLPSLLFPCPFTHIPERAAFLSCLLHGKLHQVFDRK